jgi:hypothetical protein
MFIITQVPHATHAQVHLRLVLTVINISNTLIKHNGMDTLKIKLQALLIHFGAKFFLPVRHVLSIAAFCVRIYRQQGGDRQFQATFN